MTQIIYVDVLFAVNMLLTYLLLAASVKILRLPQSGLRLLSGALLGGVYSMLIFAPPLGFILNTVIKLFTSITIVCAGMKPRSFRKLLKCTVCFFSVSFSFAGIMYFIENLFAPPLLTLKNGTVYIGINFITVIICAVVSYCAVLLINHFISKRAPQDKIFEVSIKICGLEVTELALLDTGNTLTDAVSGYPVIVVTEELIRPLYPKTLRGFFSGSFILGEQDAGEWQNRIGTVPVTGAAGDGLLPSFRPDYITVSDGNITRRVGSVIVAVTAKRFENGEYAILLNRKICEDFGDEIYEKTVEILTGADIPAQDKETSVSE